MSYENIIFEINENIAVVKFNRPKALNAINRDVLRELGDALDEIEADKKVKALVLTGEGEKAFVAGADIGQKDHLWMDTSLKPINVLFNIVTKRSKVICKSRRSVW